MIVAETPCPAGEACSRVAGCVAPAPHFVHAHRLIIAMHLPCTVLLMGCYLSASRPSRKAHNPGDRWPHGFERFLGSPQEGVAN